MQMHNITGDVRAKFHLRQNPKEYFPMLGGQIRPPLTLLYYIRFVGLRILRLKKLKNVKSESSSSNGNNEVGCFGWSISVEHR